MAVLRNGLQLLFTALLLNSVPTLAFGNNVLSTNSYQTCLQNAPIQVNSLFMRYNRLTQELQFNVSGESEQRQEVMAKLSISAYGNEVYNKAFDPCDDSTYVKQLCPVPAGSFVGYGDQKLPDQFASMIPSIAFSFPDLDGVGTLTLTSRHSDQTLACIQSHIGNGMTMKIPAVSYAAAGIAGAALVLSGLSSLSAFNHPGSSGSSPSFIETITWFQSIAMNGMLSVNYPGVYQSFSQNFAFSTGLISWDSLQQSIDNFRAKTGGDLYHDNINYLKRVTIVSGGTDTGSQTSIHSRGVIFHRDGVHGNVNPDPSQQGQANSNQGDQIDFVHGIQGYAEKLLVPQSNVFMTVLLVFAIVLAGITAGILLFKIILEAWALFGSFPKNLVGFRKRYWLLLGKTITNLIMALYSVWTLYCIYQFTNGDSWAAQLLAGVTLGIFTAILAFFTIKIWMKARQAKKAEGDASALFEDKNTWVKYSLFYDNYKRSCWWLFVPVIIYMFAKGCVIAGGNNHGLIQCGGQLIVDSLLLILLLWSRPYSFASGNWINITIQVVRVLSVVCILVFVEELGIDQTTKTVTGLVLIVVQAVLTGVLAILIAVNWLIQVCKKNPHRKARKEAEKLRSDEDELTPLDAHNSMLMYSIHPDQKLAQSEVTSVHTRGRSKNGYDMVSITDTNDDYRDHSKDPIVRSGRRMGSRDDLMRTESPESGYYLNREPQLPDISYKGQAI